MIKFEDNDDNILNENIFTEGSVSDFLKDAKDAAKDAAKDFTGVDVDKFADDFSKTNGAGDKFKLVGNTANSALDTATKLTGGIKDAIKDEYYDRRSIIARARKSVLQFPIYITQTMRPNEAQIISKLFERVYTTLVQAVLAQNPIISEDEANNLLFLKKFHTNITESGDLFANVYYQPIDELDEMMTESVLYEETLMEGVKVKFRWIPASECTDLIKENARLINEPLTGFRSLMEDSEQTSTTNKYKEVPVTDDEFRELARLIAKETGHNNAQDEEAVINANVEAIKKCIREQDLKYLNSYERKYVGGKLKHYKYRDGRYFRQDVSRDTNTRVTKDGKFAQAAKAPILLRDSDIKKINGMLPYTIEASFIIKGSNISREVKFIIGVKSVLHPIRVQDLAEDLPELISGNVRKLQKVRYKTGEIGFLDYMFNIKGLKADAAKRINYNKRWLNTLKRLGEYEKLNGSFLKRPVKMLAGGSAPIPNGTLILSQADVTALTDQTGIDLSVVRNAKKLAKSIFLICVVIVDSAAGSMRVLFTDSDNDWDVQSLAAIDSEVSKTDNSPLLAEMRKLINK
jgi:hypothetical protein